MLIISLLDPEHKVHHHRRQQRQRQNCRPKAIVNPRLPSLPNTLRPPVESDQGIDHGCHCDEREQTGGDPTDTVPEVQKSNGQPAQDHCEIQP